MVDLKLLPEGNCISEDEILDKIRNSDIRTFQLLFDKYYAKLCNFVIGFVQSSDVAEDIVQDLFLKIWERRDSLRPKGSIRSYLFVCARNAAIDYLRKQKLKRTYICDIYLDIEDKISLGPEKQLEFLDLSVHLQSIMKEMSERQRTTFILNRIYGLTYREIADIHGISIKTVETHMARALKLIREKMIEYIRV